ncbi:hypothetical protein Aspvir_010094 [Aspergillus viridinutans]|uniref:Uncharacterized protein n=1 Tax=Aspergillus viridinutans TaxID=75553 RepID=A0A9P3C1Q9_ASPVI|nr:uncharacterized protein Aspvir_010094 [Aspergillus viridinutans]GIK05977.1 hypothetical protein Aspvir_010094 [Aspergillus viridinutans]
MASHQGHEEPLDPVRPLDWSTQNGKEVKKQIKSPSNRDEVFFKFAAKRVRPVRNVKTAELRSRTVSHLPNSPMIKTNCERYTPARVRTASGTGKGRSAVSVFLSVFENHSIFEQDTSLRVVRTYVELASIINISIDECMSNIPRTSRLRGFLKEYASEKKWAADLRQSFETGLWLPSRTQNVTIMPRVTATSGKAILGKRIIDWAFGQMNDAAIEKFSRPNRIFPVRDGQQPGRYKAGESRAPSVGEPLTDFGPLEYDQDGYAISMEVRGARRAPSRAALSDTPLSSLRLHLRAFYWSRWRATQSAGHPGRCMRYGQGDDPNHNALVCVSRRGEKFLLHTSSDVGPVPNALIDTWLAELQARLGDAFSVLLFQGNSLHTSDYLRKSLIVDTLTDLKAQEEDRAEDIPIVATKDSMQGKESKLVIYDLVISAPTRCQILGSRWMTTAGMWTRSGHAEQLFSWLNGQVNFRQAYPFSWSDIIALLADIASNPGAYGVPPENAANLVLIHQDITRLRRPDGADYPVPPPPQNIDRKRHPNWSSALSRGPQTTTSGSSYLIWNSNDTSSPDKGIAGNSRQRQQKRGILTSDYLLFMDSGVQSRTGLIDRERSSAADRTFTSISQPVQWPVLSPPPYK